MRNKINKIWKLFLYYTFCIVCFASCVTEKQRRKICAECKSMSFDSTKTETITKIKDTTIFVSSDPVIQYIKSPCDSLGNLKDFNYTKYENGVKNVVKAIGGVLITECKVDSLRARIVYLEKLQKTSTVNKEVKEITTNYLTKFQKFCIWFFWGVVVTSFLYIVIKIIRLYYRF